jgi:hypothetical protein
MREDLEQRERRDKLRFPLQGQRRDRLGADGRAHQAVRRLSEQDLPGRRRLLEAGCDVHGVTGHQRLSLGLFARYDLARGEPDPRRDPHATVAFELVVQRRESALHLGGRSDGSEGIVLMDRGDPEHRHHSVADVLLDRAAVTPEHRLHLLEETRHQSTERFRIELLPERGRFRDVAEQHGDRLANLTTCASGHEPSLGRFALEDEFRHQEMHQVGSVISGIQRFGVDLVSLAL